MQGGFHAIGDAAIATVLAGFAAAARTVGMDRLRAARHRIEHAEIMDKRLIAGLVEFGVVASMQPAFDRLWGGAGRMYAQRLGVARSLESNPMGAMHGVGVALAFGSDSPVTPLDPWGVGAGGGGAPQPGAADERAGGVRGAHPGRLAGGAPGRRGRAGAGRAGDVRGVVDAGGRGAGPAGAAGRGPGVRVPAIRRRAVPARSCAATVI